MSYTSDVKKELTLLDPGKNCCKLAQISGFLRFAGSITLMGGLGIKVVTENPAVARYFATLIKDYFGTKTSLNVEESTLTKGHSYQLHITADLNADAILRETGILSVKEGSNYITDGLSWSILRKKCCKKSVLRAVFMASGSVSAPTAKGHHLEIACNSLIMAEDLKKLMAGFGLEAKITQRRGKQVVYIKDGEQIIDFLKVIGVSTLMFSYQDVLITRSMKNKANRLNNCENANVDKTVAAASKQLENIRLIEEKQGLISLPAKLREAAMLRLEYPELSLTELAEYFDPPLKKSGINHRFEKIADIAEKLR